MDSFDDSGGKNEATTAEVERVLDILQRLYRQTKGKNHTVIRNTECVDIGYTCSCMSAPL